ncbi:unnamed protein product [Ectocarpus sp. CCAP 1310/34]|nr:unnamed protein product [Ectocarpus sp. CCAP 1310/34]
MRGMRWLWAGALASTVGNAMASTSLDRSAAEILAFGSCGSIASGVCSSSIRSGRAGPQHVSRISAEPATMSLTTRVDSGDSSAMRPGGEATVAGTRGAGLPSFWATFSPSRAGRGRALVSPLSAKADSDESGVINKKAEFYGNSAPGAVAPKGAEKQDEAAVEYAVGGDWDKSVQLIKAMRDSDFVPSVNAYVATIEACRKAGEYDHASTLLSDMNKVCLPEDLIKAYAAPHPNAPGVTQTQKVFCLAMMMRQDKIEPFEETYRAIMGLASKEKLWQVSLLLVEHLKRNGLVPGKFVYDEICSVLFKTGHPEMATMIFEDALGGNIEELNSFAPPELDLHNHTVSTALAAVRVVLLDMARKPSTRPFHDPTQELLIITGMGNNSKDGEAVIKPRVMELLSDMGLEPSMMRNNEGCIVLQPADLQAYMARTAGD